MHRPEATAPAPAAAGETTTTTTTTTPGAAGGVPTQQNTCLGYAARLSPYAHKGVTGLPERLDASRVLSRKLVRLVAMVREATDTSAAAGGVVALTGAGLSTAAGIPDFRGPRGIWTLEDEEARRRNKRQKTASPAALRRRARREASEAAAQAQARASSTGSSSSPAATAAANDGSDRIEIAGASFESARPTAAHMALVALERAGKLRWLATQNVDGLDLRAGFPRRKLGILHGCVFTERCERCGFEYVRDRDVGGVKLQKTGRLCDACGGPLRDTVLDWDDALPDHEWDPTAASFQRADLALCLGTSLRITPAADLPLAAKRFVVVNLQPTPHDSNADLVIRARVDDVMTHLLTELAIAPITPPPPPPNPNRTNAAEEKAASSSAEPEEELPPSHNSTS